MARITLHNDRSVSATYVSNYFIDHYMTAANGEYVKIYLYLLRCMGASDNNFSLSAAADKLDHTEKDIQRALKYWEKMHLLRLEYDNGEMLSGIYLLDADANASREHASQKPASIPAYQEPQQAKTVPTTEADRQPEADPVAAKPTPGNYTATQLDSFREKENVRELLFVTEHYLKRPLTPTDIQTIFFWYDELQLPIDVIEYLIEYCVGKGHTSLRYMDKVARSWKETNIRTVEQAKRASVSYGQLHFTIMKALGINGRNLVDFEATYIEKWSKTYGFTSDIITEACRRTISAIQKPSFEYTDSILSNWYKQGVHHLNDIVKLDSNFQKSKTEAALSNQAASTNRFHNFSQRTYDYDKLEQQLLKSPSGQEAICP